LLDRDCDPTPDSCPSVIAFRCWLRAITIA
jgi:hypothetical protein